MTVISSISAITAISATVNLTGYGADGTIDIQISPRSDFQFCVCPVYNFARAAAIAIPGLNQRGTYWARARNRAASGAIETWSVPRSFRTSDATAQSTAPAAVMIEPALLVIPETPTSIVSTFAMPGFPVANLLRDSPVAFRKLQNYAGGFTIDVEMSGVPVDSFALLNTNLPEAATWYVQAAATQGGAELYNSGARQFRASPNLPQRPGYHGFIKLPSPQAYPWWRITIDNAVLPATMLHAEHLIVGLNRTSKNFATEKTETPAPLTSVDRKRSGIVDRVRGRPMRKVDFELQMLTEAQYETIYGDLWRRENDAAFVIPNTKQGGFLHDRMLLGDLTGGRIVNPTSPRFNRGFSVNSII